MTETTTPVQKDAILHLYFEEKGDLAHAIRCTTQALERASNPLVQKVCAFRLKMLRDQLARQRAV